MDFHKQVSSESVQFTTVSFSILWAPCSKQFCSYWNSCTIFDLVMDTFNVHIKWRAEGENISLPAPRRRVSQFDIWGILNGSVLTLWSWKSDLSKSHAQPWWQVVRQVAAHPLVARVRELLSTEVNGKRKGQLLEGKNSMWSKGTRRNVRITREDNFSLKTGHWNHLTRDLRSEAVPHPPKTYLFQYHMASFCIQECSGVKYQLLYADVWPWGNIVNILIVVFMQTECRNIYI